MELKEVMLKRRSVRKFTKEKVSQEDIQEILDSAMAGPSACNKMPWEFYVVENEDILQELHSASKWTDIDAPLAIVVCGNLSRALPLQLADFWIHDCSAASENILLRACDLGLGSVWCGIYPQKNPIKKVQKILDLKEKIIPLNIIYIGYPDQNVEPRTQFEEKRVHYVK